MLTTFILFVGLIIRHSESIEDVRSGRFVLKGFVNVGAKKGDEVELQTSIGSIYGMKFFRGSVKNGSAGICGYTVYDDAPSTFKVVDVRKETGEARLVLSKDLDGNKKQTFSIEIAPHTCSTGRHLEKLDIFIQVIKPLKWKPKWRQASYSAEVVEGKFFSPILKVELEQEPDQGNDKKVCGFKIITGSVPFEVDQSGAVSNSEPLDASRKDKWIFQLVGEPCDGEPSDPIEVIVSVKPSCRPEWIGIPEKIEFSPHDGRKLLAPEAELSLCDSSHSCNITSAFVSIKLSTTHIGKGCDRDTYSLDSQRKLCGASLNAIDLLPSPSSPNSWTKDMRIDDGKESDEVFAFDGKKDAVEVTQEIDQFHLGRHFTISTWMKHEKEDEINDGSTSRKENIICVSDSEEMNRQHVALFLHRCHLVLLLRQEPGAGLERDAYAPAEWRWTLPEVCDGAWHHYAVDVYDGSKEEEKFTSDEKLSAPLPKVKLHIDGKEFLPTKKNPNMVNDFPLHRSKIQSTKTVVGGCWMGGMNRIRNHFKGYLAGLSFLNNENEASSVIECLTKCQEKLDFTGLGDMDAGMTLSLNNEKTSITIGGPGLTQVENLLRKVAYVNTRNFPTPGLRPITFDTRATCDNGKLLDVEVVKSLLLVSRIEKPLIVLKGSAHFDAEEGQLKGGVAIFRDLDISTHSKSQADEVYQGIDGKKPQFMNKYHLDGCVIKVNVPLAPNIESLTISSEISSRFKVKVKCSPNGINISGVDKLENYEKVVSSVKYLNSRPSDLNQRNFGLVCTELNGRYVSNQLDVSMGVIHKVEHKAEPQAALVNRMSRPVGSVVPGGDDQPRIKSIQGDQSSGSATGVVIVCVVCIGFIALLAAVGVSRIRNAQRHSRDGGVDDKQEMEWDNSALTITVNPMDQEGIYDDETSLVSILNNNNNNISSAENGNSSNNHHHHHRHHHHHHHDDDDTDVDDDDVSCHDSSCVDDDDDEEEVAQGKMKKGELEWDDSTLSY